MWRKTMTGHHHCSGYTSFLPIHKPRTCSKPHIHREVGLDFPTPPSYCVWFLTFAVEDIVTEFIMPPFPLNPWSSHRPAQKRGPLAGEKGWARGSPCDAVTSSSVEQVQHPLRDACADPLINNHCAVSGSHSTLKGLMIPPPLLLGPSWTWKCKYSTLSPIRHTRRSPPQHWATPLGQHCTGLDLPHEIPAVLQAGEWTHLWSQIHHWPGAWLCLEPMWDSGKRVAFQSSRNCRYVSTMHEECIENVLPYKSHCDPLDSRASETGSILSSKNPSAGNHEYILPLDVELTWRGRLDSMKRNKKTTWFHNSFFLSAIRQWVQHSGLTQ